MATLDINCPADTGAFLRRLGRRISELAADIPDNCPTGGTNVLRIDNNPGAGSISVQIVSGPNQTRKEKQ